MTYDQEIAEHNRRLRTEPTYWLLEEQATRDKEKKKCQEHIK